MATTTDSPWQAQIIEQLGLQEDDPSLTHAVVYLPHDGEADEPDLLDRCESHAAALVSAEDWATKVAGGDVTIVKLDDLIAWNRDPSTTIEATTIEPQRQNVETEEPERVLEESPAPDEDDEADETLATPEPMPGEQAKAFDPSDYDREDLQIPRVDGSAIDRIALKWTGEIHLDRSDPADVALYNSLRFGKDVTLMIEGRCNSTGAKGATDREGDLDVVIGVKSIKVHTVYRPAGAEA